MTVGHIEEIQFPKWLSNVFLVPKPGGKWRMCTDFRDLNKACPKDFYPLPRIDQLVDSTSSCELLSTMDASHGYHQIMLALEDRFRITQDLPSRAPPTCQTLSRGHPLPIPFRHPQAVSSFLIHEDEEKQMLIYYVSKVLNGAEGRYTLIEKMALALVIIARRLRLYFLSHSIGVKTNMPLKQTLGKPDTSGHLVKWTVELSEYDISYLPRTIIKVQALADLVSEMTGISLEDAPKTYKWLLHVDGSSTTQGSGTGIAITSPQGEDLEFVVKFEFKASNNEAKYEALEVVMKMTHEAGARHFIGYSDSQLVVKQVEGIYEVNEENMIQYLQQIVELKTSFGSFQIIQIRGQGVPFASKNYSPNNIY
ncbi:UNVERIFIED_CONTAM: hypothetical protein Slati_4481300 [Sesamum latifolium]|uniref:RNase H type-1 domain-containing protein n=1 Tax=Sesamum latifolium TaxID=2727402 RepID=A0AAW2SRE3_9LAMI